MNELDKVFKLAQISPAFDGLVIVPKDVSFNGVEPCALQLQQAVAPEFARTARVVKSGAKNECVLVIDGETTWVVTNEVRILELVFPLRRHEHGKHTPAPSAERCRQGRANCGLKKASSGGIHWVPDAILPLRNS